jgi:lipopolysaccharide export LptBFGC system permease protein LptF
MPAGRDKFVAVGAAYERLRAGAAGRVGTRPAVILLLLQVPQILAIALPQTVGLTTA